MTPTALTLRRLRQLGYACDVVERGLPHANIRRDLFGIADVAACHPVRREIVLIQATNLGHVGDRLARVKSRPELRVWLAAGGLYQVWGWIQRAGRWTVKVVEVQAEDLAEVLITSPPRRGKRPRQRELFDGLDR